MKQNTLLLPTNDFVFKKVFAENPDLLASLLSSALDVPESELESLEVQDANLRPDTIADKEAILDIKVRTKASVLDVEIQVRNLRELPKRIQYYLSSLYVEQLKAGDKYKKLNKAISIFITGFKMFDDEYWYHRFHYHDDVRNVRFPESNEFLILELPKVGLATGLLADWLRFVYAKKEEDFMQAAAQNPLINKAYGVIRVLSQDEQARWLAESREKALRDAWSREDEARDDAFKSVALKMVSKNYPFEEISDVTGFSVQEVEKIAAEYSLK